MLSNPSIARSEKEPEVTKLRLKTTGDQQRGTLQVRKGELQCDTRSHLQVAHSKDFPQEETAVMLESAE